MLGKRYRPATNTYNFTVDDLTVSGDLTVDNLASNGGSLQVTTKTDAGTVADGVATGVDLLYYNPLIFYYLQSFTNSFVNFADPGTNDGTKTGTSGNEYVSSFDGKNNVFLFNANTGDDSAPTVYVDLDANVASFQRNAFTVKLWMRASTIQTTETVFSISDPSQTGRSFEIQFDDSSGSEIAVVARDNSTSANYRVSYSVSASTWYHVIVTFGDAGLRLYVDNDLRDSDALSGNTFEFDSNFNASKIGGNETSAGLEHGYPGELSDFAYFERELSSGEVYALYNQKAAVSGAGLTAPLYDAVSLRTNSLFHYEHGSTLVTVTGISNTTNLVVYPIAYNWVGNILSLPFRLDYEGTAASTETLTFTFNDALDQRNYESFYTTYTANNRNGSTSTGTVYVIPSLTNFVVTFSTIIATGGQLTGVIQYVFT